MFYQEVAYRLQLQLKGVAGSKREVEGGWLHAHWEKGGCGQIEVVPGDCRLWQHRGTSSQLGACSFTALDAAQDISLKVMQISLECQARS